MLFSTSFMMTEIVLIHHNVLIITNDYIITAYSIRWLKKHKQQYDIMSDLYNAICNFNVVKTKKWLRKLTISSVICFGLLSGPERHFK